jgi:hypothetical protein
MMTAPPRSGFRGPAAPLGRRTHTGLAHRNRRLAKDFEATIASAKAWLYLGSVQLLIRRLGHEDETTYAVLSWTFSGYQRGRFAIMIISSPPLG